MPGLNQLKKFSADILEMGKEPERRRAKGETLPRVLFPENASEADDSSQFVLGLPQEGDFTSDTAGTTSSDAAGEDEEIDIDALLANALGGGNNNNADEPAAEAVPEPVPSLDTDADTLPSLDDDIFGDISSPDASAGALDALADFEADTADLFSDPAIDDLTAPEAVADIEQAEPAVPAADEPFADMPEADPVADLLSDFDIPAPDADASAGGFEDFSFGADDIAAPDTTMDAGSLDALSDFEQAEEPAPSAINDEFAISDDTQMMDMNEDIPETMQEGSGLTEDPFAGMGELDFSDSSDVASDVSEAVPDISDSSETGGDEIADLASLSDFDEPADAAGDFDLSSLGSLDTADELENVSVEDFAIDDAGNVDSSAVGAETGSDDFSMPDFDLGGDAPGGSDNFDLPPVEGLDAMDLGGEESSGGFDFGSSEDFSIPGFSDFDMIPQDAGPAKTETASTKKQKEEPPPLKTELTDSEYKTFLENLDYYPLNVRLALQDMIVKNEFTDDAVMDVIHKVIKKIPARQLAAHLEKLLDVSLPVPVNYEKRTAAEYEAYKQSLAYQLRNKIIPIAIASFFSLMVCVLFGWLIAKFVVTPVKAELLYKEGYELISNGLYPQSEQKFNEAVSYKAKKNWYFTFARGYREKRQYDRSAGIYQRLLNRFDHDLTAGLEYANMELYDRFNYEHAEEVVRREILDYHLDDPDGMLLLGDIFLEWATNTDPEEVIVENDEEKIARDVRFEKARYAYEDLMYVHGQTDLHLSRMLRYFIRTDTIKKVLELKGYFYPKLQKNALKTMATCDQVELAGYMLDKLYGPLSPQNEYLRAYVEDVRDLLEIAIKSCEKTDDEDAYPEAVYNYARYFVETSNPASAATVLQRAIGLLDGASKKSHNRTLRTVNAYRLLGEIYSNEKKYIEAENMYAQGLTLFETEQKYNALKPDENVGLLYADKADIDYFLSGDYGAALSNYQKAIENKYDTPSIRYRIGWIQYANGNYSEALGSFIKVITDRPSEKNALFALGNTLAFRNSTSAAAGYYEMLLDSLDREIQRADVSLTRVQDVDQEDLFTLYMKATNNLGVALSQVAAQTSDSAMHARAITQFSSSIQAYDALHRNPETYVRLEGSNLAEMNLKYLTVPDSVYEPEYYSDLPRVLEEELMLRQADE